MGRSPARLSPSFDAAQGDVLELGVGNGATFAHYPPTLSSLTGLDISNGMLARL